MTTRLVRAGGVSDQPFTEEPLSSSGGWVFARVMRICCSLRSISQARIHRDMNQVTILQQLANMFLLQPYPISLQGLQ